MKHDIDSRSLVDVALGLRLWESGMAAREIAAKLTADLRTRGIKRILTGTAVCALAHRHDWPLRKGRMGRKHNHSKRPVAMPPLISIECDRCGQRYQLEHSRVIRGERLPCGLHRARPSAVQRSTHLLDPKVARRHELIDFS